MAVIVADREEGKRQRAAQAVRNLNSPQASVRESAARSPVLQSPSRPSSGGGGGGGSSSSGGGDTGDGGGSTKESYWYQPDWQDSAYNAQLAAVNRALADYETELGLKGERYGTDYVTGVRKLGYRPGAGFTPTVDIFKLPEVSDTGASGSTGLSAVRQAMMPVTSGAAAAVAEGEATPMARLASTGGTWDYEGQFDPFSAAARGTRTTRDEFAGRGTLRSSDFARNYSDFQQRMQDQLNAMETGRARFFEDAAINLAQERASAEERRQAARVNAMTRAAAAGEYRTR